MRKQSQRKRRKAVSDLHAHVSGVSPKRRRSLTAKHDAGFMFRLPSSLHQEMKQQAEAEAMSIATWVRRIMLKELRQRPTL
jgi:predicted HicB family RNase H-like nuclease